jgi:hypothetical protein
MTTSSPKTLRDIVAPIREPAAFALLGAAALVLLAALTNLVPTDFQRPGSVGYGFYLAIRPPGFLSLVTVVAPVLAVLLVTGLGDPSPRARLVTGVAAVLLAAAAFLGLVFELLLGSIGMIVEASFMDSVKRALPLAAVFGLALLGLLVVLRVWQGQFQVAKPAPAGWGGYGQQPQYGQAYGQTQPQYGQPHYGSAQPQYGQAAATAGYQQPGQPGAGQPQSYGQPTQPGAGQPQSYGQPTQPGPGQPQSYGQPTQPAPATGQPTQPADEPPSYGQPTAPYQAPTGQPGVVPAPPSSPPGPAAGQVYGQPAGSAPAGPDDPDRTRVVPPAGAPGGTGESGPEGPGAGDQDGSRGPGRRGS